MCRIYSYFTGIHREIELVVEECRQAVLPPAKLCFIGVKEEDVVHITDVVAYFQRVLCVHICRMEVDIGEELASEVANRNTSSAFGMEV